MGVETATYVSDLDAALPAATDQESQGDDHLRLIKATGKTTFPNASKPFRFPVTSADKTGGYTVVTTDENSLIPCDATSAAFTVTLIAAPNDGFRVALKKVDGSVNRVTIDGDSSDTIDGATTIKLTRQHEGVILQWDGNDSEWHVIAVIAPVPRALFNKSAKSAGFTATAADHGKIFLVDTSSGAITAALTAAATLGDEFYFALFNLGTANNVTIDPNSAELINNAATYTVVPQGSVLVYCDGTEFYVIGFSEDVNTLKATVSDDLEVGFTSTSKDQGTKSSGTFTPAFATGGIQHCVNGGAFTLAAPTGGGTMLLDILNNASAGAITLSGFAKTAGDSFDTTNGSQFRCNISNGNNGAMIHVTKF